MSMGKGTIWTETDIDGDAWYAHDNRMPAGVMIESARPTSCSSRTWASTHCARASAPTACSAAR